MQEHLDQGNSVRTMTLNAEERSLLREFWLLTGKPLMVVVNVDEDRRRRAGCPTRSRSARGSRAAMRSPSRRGSRTTSPSSTPADRAAFLHDLGLEEPGLHRVARSAYRLLRLITFFTAGETEVRAWNLREGETALDAAASIHTDLARGFIRAEVTDAEELLTPGRTRCCASVASSASRVVTT